MVEHILTFENFELKTDYNNLLGIFLQIRNSFIRNDDSFVGNIRRKSEQRTVGFNDRDTRR